MPVYEYFCKACETDFDDLVRMGTPDEEIECPRCGKHEAKRLLSVFSSGGSASEGTGATSSSASCGHSGFS